MKQLLEQMTRLVPATHMATLDEEIITENNVSVKKNSYSWGKMVTVHDGIRQSFPLHPEHQEKIRSLKDGESTQFFDETNAKVKATRQGDKVHLAKGERPTTVSLKHFNEATEIDEMSFMPTNQAKKIIADHAHGLDINDPEHRKTIAGRIARKLGKSRVVIKGPDSLAHEGAVVEYDGIPLDEKAEVKPEEKKDDRTNKTDKDNSSEAGAARSELGSLADKKREGKPLKKDESVLMRILGARVGLDEGVRSPTDTEYNHAAAHAKSKGKKLGSIGVDKQTGHINVQYNDNSKEKLSPVKESTELDENEWPDGHARSRFNADGTRKACGINPAVYAKRPSRILDKPEDELPDHVKDYKASNIVTDRKTGKAYNPHEEMKKHLSEPSVVSMLKRLKDK